jgi:hypothetical protein
MGGIFLVAMLLPLMVQADNQFIRRHPSSDPAPSVFTDSTGVEKVYFYCTQDMLNGNEETYDIDTIHCYSSPDMYHWKDEGGALWEKLVTWCNDANQLWAPTVYFLQGRYQLIAPETATNGYFYNFTSWNTKPTGTFTPASVGVLPHSTDNVIDPFVFADTTDSVRIWLSYRHQDKTDLGLVRMNDSGTAVDSTGTGLYGYIGNSIVQTGSGSGYHEGSWIFKRNGFYFLVYAFQPGSKGNEIIAYSVAHSVLGPWTYKGQILPTNSAEFTIHSGVCNFKGQYYIFWHNVTYGGELFGDRRCSAIEYLNFKNDSTIDTSTCHKDNRGVGVPSAYDDSIQIDRGIISTTSATTGTATIGMHAYNYLKVNAQDIADTGWYLTGITNNATVVYDSVNFTPDSGYTGPTSFTMQVATTVGTDTIYAYLDSVNGQLLAKTYIPNTSDTNMWNTITVADSVKPLPTGHHNLAIKFKVPTGTNNLQINWVHFGETKIITPVLPNNAGQVPSLFSCERLGKSTFEITCAAASDIKLVNLAGRQAAPLTQTRSADQKSVRVSFDATKVSSGVYVLSVKNADGVFHHQFVF